MKKMPIFLLLILRLSVISGQINPLPETFVYHYNGLLVNAENLEVKLTPIGNPYFQIDDSKIQLDDVKFYKDFSGFYANVKNLNRFGISFFARQISKGKVNTYQYGRTITNRPTLESSSNINSDVCFYNKGFGDLKIIGYAELKNDLADNPEALSHLNNYEFCKFAHTGFALAGLFSLIEGIIISVKQTKRNQDAYTVQFMAGNKSVSDNPGISLAPSLIGLGGGIGCFFIARRFTICKQKQLQKAIDVYNQ
jgi:hypothetical protein